MNKNGSRPDHPSVIDSQRYLRRCAPSRPQRSAPEPLEQRIAPASFLVINANSDGPGSLRDAILQANASPGFDTIDFNIDGTGPFVIQLLPADGPLPAIRDSVAIDGYTQSGSTPNSSPGSTPRSNAVLNIVLDGSLLPDGDGLVIQTSSSLIAGLVIQGFKGAGIRIDSDAASDNSILGNFIGTDVDGKSAKPNGVGIVVFKAGANFIGSQQPGGRNIISGNDGEGILLDSNQGPLGEGLIVLNNLIGLDRSGDPLGNRGHGIAIRDSSNLEIGGTEPGQPNFIAYNGGHGVAVGTNSPQPEEATFGNSIRGNSIFENAGLGINLGRDGVTLNDPGDSDVGANGRLNFPLITDVTILPTISSINGILRSAPNTTFLVDFYVSGKADPSGYGEGARYIGTVLASSDAAGNAPFNFTVNGDFRGLVFTTTSTDIGRRDTSEFSLAYSPLLVTTEADTTDALDGLTSLREAILFANANPDFSTITFNIPGGGVRSIRPLTNLPDIIHPVFIDGYSQPGASPNTLGFGNDGVLLIELQGSQVATTGPAFALNILGGGSTVRGLVINRFADGGINITGPGGNVIVGNWIGTNPDGTSAPAVNNKSGIDIIDSSNNFIGGVAPADHNIISGNLLYPINIRGGTNSAVNVIKGNGIGTTKDATAPLGNGGEVYLNGVGTILGGSEPGARNIISNTAPGVDAVAIHSIGVIARHNFIGIDLTGTVTLGIGGAGIHIFAANATIGGVNANEGNIIAGAALGGIVIESDNSVIQGNYIGTDPLGTLPRPNSVAGIVITRGSNNTIGGATAGAGNTIAFNNGNGVLISGSTGIASGNAIRGNSIFGNTSIGINLGTDLVTPNDALDGDVGANRLQNFPVITGALRNAGGTVISGSLNSAPGTVFTIDFYSSVSPDPTGFGEGRFYLGSITTSATNAAGDVTFNFGPGITVPAGSAITATATNPTNDTSEFSAAQTLSSVYIWDAGAGADTSWENGINWDLDNGVPGPNDTAILTINAPINLPASRAVGIFQQSNGVFSSLNGVTLTILKDFNWTGGSQDGAGITAVDAGATLTLGGSASKTLNRTLVGNGTASWTEGAVLGNGAFVNSGEFHATAGSTFSPNFGNIAGGTFSQESGTNIFSKIFNSAGSVTIEGGTLRLDGGGTSGGVFNVAAATTLTLGAGSFQFTGTTFNGAGRIQLLATTSFDAASSFNISGATTVNGGATTTFNASAPVTFGTLNLTNGILTGSSNMFVSSSLNWDSGELGGTGSISLGAGATATLNGAGTKTLNRGFINNGTFTSGNISGTGSVTNNGVFNANLSTSIGAAFSNSASGTVNQLAGNLTFSAPFINAGTINITGGTLQLSGGFTQTAGATTLAGGSVGGVLTLQGGSLAGVGTISGALNNTGGLVRPGGLGVVGTLNVAGTYSQGAGGTLAVDLGGTVAGQFDVLAVSETASLGGTLNITNIGGFTPAVGQQFRVVTSSGNPGSFAALTGAATGISQQPDATGLVLRANALVYTWDGGAGPGNTNWFEPLNWDLDSGFPGPADTAVLGNVANNTITIPTSLSVGTFQQSAGTVTSGGGITFTVLNTLEWTGGTQSGPGATTIPAGAALNLSGGATTLNTRTLNIAGSATDSFAGGAMTLANGATVNLSGVFDFRNDDDIAAVGAGNNFAIQPGGVLVKSAGTLATEIQPAVSVAGAVNATTGILRFANVIGGNNATFNATGAQAQIELVAGTGAFAGTTNFTGGGVMRIVDANLQFNGPTSLNGAGTHLEIAGTATVSIASTLTVPVGSILSLATGTLTGAGTIDVAGTFAWNSGAHRGAGVTNIQPGGILNLSTANSKVLSLRTLNHAGDSGLQGSLNLDNGATFNLTGRLDLAADADILSTTSGNLNVLSGGLLRKSGGSGVSEIAPGVAINNSGTIQADAGTLRIGNAGGGNNATFQPLAGATLEIAGGNGSFSGTTSNNGATGITRISGGNLQFNGPVLFTGSSARFEIVNGAVSLSNTFTIGAGASLVLSAGSLGGTGNIDVLGSLEWSGGSMSGSGTTIINASATAVLTGPADKQLIGRTFANAGTVNWSGTGQFALNNATVNNSGTFNLQSNAVVSITSGTATFNNLSGGTLAKVGGGGTSTISIGVAVNNAGTIAAQSGTLDLGSSFTQTAGATVLGPGGLASPGTLVFQGGELRGSGNIAGNVNNTGATVRPGGNGASGAIAISGAYTQGSAGTLSVEIGGLNPGTQYDQLNIGGTATLDGNFQVTLLGGFTVPTGSQFQVLNAATRTGTFGTETVAPSLTRQYTPSGVLLLGPAAPPSTIVTTELDIVDPEDSLVSLREAITFANANAGLDTITFNIPGGGVRTIALGSALPTITDAVVIDGYTQPGASPNTSLGGSNATLLIELNGSSAGAANGLSINAGGSTVRGLVINGFSGEGAIFLSGGGGNVISGNFIGTNAAGTAAGPANFRGIFLSGSSNNVIGGTSPGDRNVISASQHIGVDIAFGAANNFVQGNFIGTDKTGTVALGNAVVGIFLNNSPGNIIGGTTAGARNVVSGQSLSPGSQGVSIAGGAGATGNLVQGNFIGTDVTGTIALGNSTGIIIAQGAQGNTIGGNTVGAGNLISGNSANGVQLSNPGTNGNTISGNLIGTDVSGTLTLGNGTHGVLIDGASGNTIGGVGAADRNVIAGNGLEGVTIFSGSGNAILGNAIHSNGGFGIDLGADGISLNDAGDGDAGANDLQNFPVLTLVTPDPGGTRVTGTLNSAANASVRIELFQSSTGDPSSFGEGEIFLTFVNVTTDGSGNAAFDIVIPASLALGQFVTATATDSELDNTSEFSRAVQVQSPGTVSISDGIVVEGDSGMRTVIFTATLNQAAGTIVSVNYATSDLTALAGVDYDTASGIITFGPSETEQTFAITIRSDILAEFRERFAVTLSNPQGISIGDGDAIGIIQDDDHHSVAVGQGAGNSFRVYTVNSSGATLEAELQPFASSFKGGVRVATGDINGDGVEDFIAGAGLGGRGRVRVFDGATLEPVAGSLGDFSAYGNSYRGGVFVATGDVNGDGLADIIVSPSAGSHNEVRIFSGDDGSLLSSFQALGRGSGGVRVAAGDINGDGLADIIVGAGQDSKIRVFDALSGTLLPGGEFAAFERTFRGGVFVAAGDINNDGIDDIITGAGSQSATIKIFEQGIPEPNNRSFSAYSGALKGVHVAVGDINGDGIADIIATKGSKTDGKARVFQGGSLDELLSVTPFGKASIGDYVG